MNTTFYKNQNAIHEESSWLQLYTSKSALLSLRVLAQTSDPSLNPNYTLEGVESNRTLAAAKHTGCLNKTLWSRVATSQHYEYNIAGSFVRVTQMALA